MSRENVEITIISRRVRVLDVQHIDQISMDIISHKFSINNKIWTKLYYTNRYIMQQKRFGQSQGVHIHTD